MIASISIIFATAVLSLASPLEVRKHHSSVAALSAPSACPPTTLVTVTRDASAASSVIASADDEVAKSVDFSSPVASAIDPVVTEVVNAAVAATSTSKIAVSGAGKFLNPTAVAKSQQRDNTATRAFTSASLKTSDGQCLFVNPTAGNFRENLIPVAVKPCDGSAGQKFDLITKGIHNNAANSTLIVSSLMNGCLDFDARRPPPITVHMFSCGGRADGAGRTTTSQFFAFGGGNSILLAPENGGGKTCLIAQGGLLVPGTCSGAADQLFSIVQ
jgi:hypothetical protein